MRPFPLSWKRGFSISPIFFCVAYRNAFSMRPYLFDGRYLGLQIGNPPVQLQRVQSTWLTITTRFFLQPKCSTSVLQQSSLSRIAIGAPSFLQWHNMTGLFSHFPIVGCHPRPVSCYNKVNKQQPSVIAQKLFNKIKTWRLDFM